MASPIHITTCRVLYGDTDAAGVVYNANYLRYFEIGRTELMRDWVCSYREIEKLGIILFYRSLNASVDSRHLHTMMMS